MVGSSHVLWSAAGIPADAPLMQSALRYHQSAWLRQSRRKTGRHQFISDLSPAGLATLSRQP